MAGVSQELQIIITDIFRKGGGFDIAKSQLKGIDQTMTSLTSRLSGFDRLQATAFKSKQIQDTNKFLEQFGVTTAKTGRLVQVSNKRLNATSEQFKKITSALADPTRNMQAFAKQQRELAMGMVDGVAKTDQFIQGSSRVNEFLKKNSISSKMLSGRMHDLNLSYDKNGRLMSNITGKVMKWNDATKQLGRSTKRFAMEFLGLMFFGMQLQRTFGNMFKSLIKNYRELSGKTNPLNVALTQLSANFKFLKFAIIQAASPFLIKIVDILANLTVWLSKMPDGVLKKIAFGILALAVAGAVLFSVGTISLFLNSMAQTLEKLKEGKYGLALTTLAGGLLKFAAVLIIIGVAWAVFKELNDRGVIDVSQSWEDLKDNSDGLIASLKTSWQGLGQFFTGLFESNLGMIIAGLHNFFAGVGSLIILASAQLSNLLLRLLGFITSKLLEFVVFVVSKSLEKLFKKVAKAVGLIGKLTGSKRLQAGAEQISTFAEGATESTMASARAATKEVSLLFDDSRDKINEWATSFVLAQKRVGDVIGPGFVDLMFGPMGETRLQKSGTLFKQINTAIHNTADSMDELAEQGKESKDLFDADKTGLTSFSESLGKLATKMVDSVNPVIEEFNTGLEGVSLNLVDNSVVPDTEAWNSIIVTIIPNLESFSDSVARSSNSLNREAVSLDRAAAAQRRYNRAKEGET